MNDPITLEKLQDFIRLQRSLAEGKHLMTWLLEGL